MIFNERLFCLPGGIQQCLEIFFGCHNWEEPIGIQWVEARDGAKYPTMHRAAPSQQRIIWSKMSVVSRLKTPGLWWPPTVNKSCSSSLHFQLIEGEEDTASVYLAVETTGIFLHLKIKHMPRTLGTCHTQLLLESLYLKKAKNFYLQLGYKPIKNMSHLLHRFEPSFSLILTCI